MDNKCKNCSSTISQEDLFCPNCGVSLKDKNSNTDPIEAEENYNSAPINIKQNKTSTKLIVSITLLIALIACLAFSIPYNIEKNRKYTITFDSKGGSSCYSISTNDDSVKLPEPTRSNCYFDGWYTANGTPASKAITNNAKNKKDLKFYAKWYTYEKKTLNYNTYADRPSSNGGWHTWFIELDDITYSSYNNTYSLTAKVWSSMPTTKLNSGKSLKSYIITYSSFYLNGYGTISFNGTGSKYISGLPLSSNPYSTSSIKNVHIEMNSLVEVK